MLPPEIMERLSQLNRGAAIPIVSAARPPSSGSMSTAASAGESLPGEELVTEWGKCWSVERKLFDIAPVVQREMNVLFAECTGRAITSDEHDDVRLLAGAFPYGTLFLDLETCGFAGSMIFLAGIVRATEEGPVLTQLVARTYPEEKALLQALWQFASHHEVLVTFNGKSFDWPCVHDRSTVHHLGRDTRLLANPAPHSPNMPVTKGLERSDLRPHLQHVDLLHHCRRRWKNRLPNCRLQTLERFLCGRRRVADIAGAAIPEAYHQFVRARQTPLMRSILHHNALDLVTLVQLTLRVCCDGSSDSTPAVVNRDSF